MRERAGRVWTSRVASAYSIQVFRIALNNIRNVNAKPAEATVTYVSATVLVDPSQRSQRNDFDRAVEIGRNEIRGGRIPERCSITYLPQEPDGNLSV